MNGLQKRLIKKGLNRAAKGDRTLGLVLNLDPDGDRPPARFIIFSDQHKGAGDRADEFRRCSTTYTQALKHYLHEGYTLILLGDVEELWENSFREVQAVHQQVLALEGAFGSSRYYRVYGNHDDAWQKAAKVDSELRSLIPTGASIHEGIRFMVMQGGRQIGTLLLLHGHQGTIDSEMLAGLARPALRIFWRPIAQNLLGMGRQSPSADACLRGEHDREMYAWAVSQKEVVLVAGHTHKPVWAAKSHVELLEARKTILQHDQPAGWQLAVQALDAELAVRRPLSPPCGEIGGTKPKYFNTGCCKYSDGDITGLELDGADIALVKWTKLGMRHELERCPLNTCFP